MSLYEYEDSCDNFIHLSRLQGFSGDEWDWAMIHMADEHSLINIYLPPAEIHKLIRALQKVVSE